MPWSSGASVADGRHLARRREEEDRDLLAPGPDVQHLEDARRSRRLLVEDRERVLDPGVALHAEHEDLAEPAEEAPRLDLPRILVRDAEGALVPDGLDRGLHRLEEDLLDLGPERGRGADDEGVRIAVRRGELASGGGGHQAGENRESPSTFHDPLVVDRPPP